MPADAHRMRAGGQVLVGALVVSAGYAVGAASTTPFTWAAEVMTAIPIIVVTVGAVVRWPARPDRTAGLVDEDHRSTHPYLGWVVLLAFVVGWELTEYLWRGGRGSHPTLSSMADAFDAHGVGKTVAFLAWLWLGAAIVRAGTPAGSRVRARS